MGSKRISTNIIKMLSTITIAEFTAGIVAQSYREHRGKSTIFKICSQIHDAAERARALWKEGGMVLFHEMKPYTRWLETNILCGKQHTCQRIYFCWYMLQDLQDGLWAARSNKVGVIDDIIRYIEDLFIYFKVDEEEHQKAALEQYKAWVESLNEKVVLKPRLRVSESGRVRVSA